MENKPLEISNLSCRYAGQEDYAVHNISASISQGTITGIIGPNGAGKSTILKSILDLIPHEGEVKFFGQTLDQSRSKIAYIPQRKDIDWSFPISALDVCLMGLYPRIGWLGRIQKKHKTQAMHYLETVKLTDHAHKPIGALSGGQQQRVFVARALAQQADLFLLDEPMTGVDQTTQTLLFDLFQTLKHQGKTILIVHHNLQNAHDHFDDILLINKTLVAAGKAAIALTQNNLNKAYGMIAA